MLIGAKQEAVACMDWSLYDSQFFAFGVPAEKGMMMMMSVVVSFCRSWPLGYAEAQGLDGKIVSNLPDVLLPIPLWSSALPQA